MSLKIAFILFCCFFAFFSMESCSRENTSETEETKWLLGTWEFRSPRGTIYEGWHRKNDSVLVGKSYMLAGEDTILLERIKIEKRGAELFYIPVISNQNEGKPVEFKLKSSEADQLIFQNEKHDFPQQITYRLVKQDSLVAEISGKLYGEETAQQFQMKRSAD